MSSIRLRIAALLGLVTGLAVVVPRSHGLTAAAAPAPAPGYDDWILDELARRVVEEGPPSWDDAGPGTRIESRVSAVLPFSTTEERTTLLRRDANGLTMRYERRAKGEAWSQPVERTLARGRVPGAERVVEDLGRETIEVAGRRVEANAERWSRRADGGGAKPEFVVWTDDDGRLVRWTEDLGDAWRSTFTVLRDDVDWASPGGGARAMRAREIHQVATSTFRDGKHVIERTALWVREVPEHVASETSRETLEFGPRASSQTSTRELTALETVPVRRKPE